VLAREDINLNIQTQQVKIKTFLTTELIFYMTSTSIEKVQQ
jgi:hypothetical protein